MSLKLLNVKLPENIVWKNVALLSALHAGALYGIWLKMHDVCLYSRIFFFTYAHISAFSVTAGRHRYFSHRAFKGTRVMDAILVLMCCTGFQQSIYTWCRDHRLHHKHSETDADPYNSKRGFFFCHMGWVCLKKHDDVKEKGKSVDMSDLRANPAVMFEYKHSVLLAAIFTLLLPTIVPMYFWNERFLVALFYCTIYRYTLVLHSTWCVNSFAHMYGMRTYDKRIRPVENSWVSTIAFGEGFHNYHHTFPWDYKAGELSGDVKNMTTYLIDSFARLGLVTERKTVSRALIEQRKGRTGDPKWKPIGSTLKDVFIYIIYIVLVA